MKSRLLADTVKAVTAPGLPQNTASLPLIQACGVPRLVSHQFASAVLQMPEPPTSAPVDALLPAVEPSVSQYRFPARTGPPNSDTASTAEITTTTVRSAFVWEPIARFATRLFKVPLTTRLLWLWE